MVSCRPGGCAGLCDESGFGQAYADHHALLVARARRVVVDAHLAEEVAQEAFLRAWRACARFDGDRGPLRQWLLAITVNVARDFIRARARRPTVALVEEALPATGGDLERILARTDLVEALAGLSDEHREAVLHTFLLDRPYAEVAEQLAIRPGTLRSRVHYALRRLRDELEPTALSATTLTC